MELRDAFTKLWSAVAALPDVRAIGQTGGAALPQAGEGDVDLFVLCDEIPREARRMAAYDGVPVFDHRAMTVCEGGVWGTGDVFAIQGMDVMFMYFRIDETLRYIDEILEGGHLNSVRGFYPSGRCASYLNMSILYDAQGILASLKEKLSAYPEGLRQKTTDFHLNRTLDAEDFQRALQRKDALFYHQVLEAALDHYLQTLFAANHTFFPSRKRTRQYLDGFTVKPKRCYERLLEVIRLGSNPDTLDASFAEWRGLVEELKEIL